MTTQRGWFSNFCTRCLSSKDEAKIELNFDDEKVRNIHAERSPTMVVGLKPLTLPATKATRSDTHDLKTAGSTRENISYNFENKLGHAETSSSSPRNDLELEVLESDYLEVGKKLCIRHTGYVENTQSLNSGQIVLGTELEENAQNKEQVNDIVCSKFKTGKPVQTARIIIEKTGYFLEDLGGGDGVYIRAEDKLALEDQMIIYYGIGHFLVQTMKSKDGSPKLRLKLKFLDGPNDGLEKILEPEDICTIGRLSTCTVVFNEYGVSRIQCKIFCENGKWFIKDGDGFKKSTNGTWILVNKKKSISSKTAFKVNNTVFKAQLLEV